MKYPLRKAPDWSAVDTCCLDVSLGNRYQQGTYLAGTVDWINKRFKKCIVNLGDTLHRYNLKQEYPDMESARRRCLQMGDEWIDASREILSGLDRPYEIVRGDVWLSDPEFWIVHQVLREYSISDAGFRSALAEDISQFVSRQMGASRIVAESSSRDYLLEECAADIVLGKREAVVHLYPSAWHESYFYLIRNAGRIPAALRGLETGVFKRIYPIRRSGNGLTGASTRSVVDRNAA